MKIILILAIAICFYSCGNKTTRPVGKPIIKSIDAGSTSTGNIIKYTIDNSVVNNGYDMDWFYDTVGKFNIGDTLKLIK